MDTLYTYLVHAGQEQPIGRVTDEIRVDSAAGGARLHRTYTSQDAIRGTNTHTIVDELPTLLPVSYELRSAEERTDLRFDGMRVQGEIAAPGERVRRVDRKLEAPLFNSASFDLVLRAAPLAEGARFTVPAYLAPDDQPIFLNATVIGAEPVPGAEGEPVDSWIVETDFGGSEVTFWIAKASRDLLKQTMQAGPGFEVMMVRYPLAETSVSPTVDAESTL